MGRLSGLGLSLGLADSDLGFKHAFLRRFIVEHEHSVETENRLRVLLQVDQVVLGHELALRDQEVFGHVVERVYLEAVHDKVHIEIASSDQSLESTPVLLRDAFDGELPVVLLELDAALSLVLTRTQVAR